ncbi:hypothetical protein C9439_03900 [archaeon SCG-AAA382B04]|nr:hypothetical protein C9439_03900 [archaeon SCG-AAA382B04]
MNICLVSRYFNNRNGGLGIYSENLLKELLDTEHQIDVVQSTEDQNTLRYLLWTALTIKLDIPKYSDIYHALSPWEAIWLPKNKSNIVTYHDFMPIKYSAEVYRNVVKRVGGKELFKLAMRRTNNRADYILVNSQQTKQEAEKHLDFDSSEIKITRLGISSDLESGRTEKNKDFKIGTLGRLSPRKRTHKFAKLFSKTDMDAELHIAGKGKELQKLRQLDDNRIKLHGFIPEEQKNKYLNSLDLFVLPSRLEGYGLTVVEAMKTKTPVAVAEDCLIPKDVKEKCYSFNLNKKDIKDLVNINKTKEGSYEFAKKHTWKNCSKKTLETYEEVFNE